MKRLWLLVLFAVMACQTNPYTGRSQLLIYSEEDMNKMGVSAYAEMTDPKKVKISTDPTFTEPLQRVGRAIAAAADRPDYEWEFRLIEDDKTANAWALPGGKIAFYTGIYPILQDEAGMAIVMGHEVMHAILQHSNERVSQKVAVGAVMAAAAVATKDSEYRGAILAGLGVGATLGYVLPYSRKHESEADHQGLLLAAKAGYDPQAAIGVWERMGALSEGKAPPVFLSTHPATAQRIENMQQWMPEATRLYEQSVRRPNRPLPRFR